MEIKLNDCTLQDALDELKFQQKKYPNAHFSGKGSGEVVIKCYDDEIIVREVKNGNSTILN